MTETETNGAGRSNYYVYVYLNPLKGMQPFYVGRGCGDRVRDHLKPSQLAKNCHKSRTIAKIRRETGEDPPFTIHSDGLTFEESCRVERELISLYGRVDIDTGVLTNLTDGGDGPANPSPETRRRMSLAKEGTIAVLFPDGTRARVSADDPRWVSGELVGQTKGMPCHENTRKRAIEMARTRVISPEQGRKIADALRGRKQSPGHISALAATRKGRVFVRSRNGGRAFKVAADDPRLVTGELRGVTSGRVWVNNPLTRECKVVAATDIPAGFVRGRIL